MDHPFNPIPNARELVFWGVVRRVMEMFTPILGCGWQ